MIHCKALKMGERLPSRFMQQKLQAWIICNQFYTYPFIVYNICRLFIYINRAFYFLNFYVILFHIFSLRRLSKKANKRKSECGVTENQVKTYTDAGNGVGTPSHNNYNKVRTLRIEFSGFFPCFVVLREWLFKISMGHFMCYFLRTWQN